MAWITPITDWDGVTTSPNNRKYYNYSDLNRVENNCNELQILINTYSYIASLLGIDTARDNTSLIFYDDLNRIETNILALKTVSGQPLDWIAPKVNWKTLDTFSYIDANRLESNLLGLYTMINNIIKELKYCGATTCGEDISL